MVEVEGSRVARAVLLPPGRAGHGRAHRHRAGPPQPPAGAGAARLVGRPVDRARRRPVERGVRREPTGSGRAEPPSGGRLVPARPRPRVDASQPPRSTTTSTCGTTPSASSATSASTPAASSGRTPSPSASPAGASTPASPPSTTSPLHRLGLRLLRQLHRGVPDRRAGVQERVRPAGRGDLGRGAPDPDRHHLPLLRRGLHPHAPRAGQRDRQGHLAPRPPDDPRQPLHQGPVRLPARPEPRSRLATPSRRSAAAHVHDRGRAGHDGATPRGAVSRGGTPHGSLRRPGGHRHRRRARHRPRARADPGRAGRQGRRQRPRRQRRRHGRRPQPGRAGGRRRSTAWAARPSPTATTSRRGRAPSAWSTPPSRRFGDLARRGQQRRHPARPDADEHDRGGVGRGHQGPPQGHLRPGPLGRRLLAGAGQGRQGGRRPHHQHHVGVGHLRQPRPDQLRRGQGRHRRVHHHRRARAGPLRRDGQRRRPGGADPHDRGPGHGARDRRGARSCARPAGSPRS